MPFPPTYRLVLAVPLPELVPFVRRQLGVLTGWSLAYWGLNAGILGWILYRILHLSPSLDAVVVGLGQGFFVFFVLLLPLHEGIHAAAYKLVGAPRVRFGAQWRRLVFYAYADGFVVGRQRFTLVAIAPCVVLNGLVLLGLVWLPARFEWPLLGGLLLHTGGCFGDFGLINYFHQQRHRQLYTVDDVATGTVYFVE